MIQLLLIEIHSLTNTFVLLRMELSRLERRVEHRGTSRRTNSRPFNVRAKEAVRETLVVIYEVVRKL